MKYAIQISQSADCAWAITQLTQKAGSKTYTNTGKTLFVDYALPLAHTRLLQAIEDGLVGKIKSTKER